MQPCRSISLPYRPTLCLYWSFLHYHAPLGKLNEVDIDYTDTFSIDLVILAGLDFLLFKTVPSFSNISKLVVY